MSDRSPDPEIDARLRGVPLPDGLLARLRACGGPTDEELDLELCSVPVPEGLVSRLRGCCGPPDEVLDGQICGVPLPAGLVDQLKQAIDDEALDEQICDVPLPSALRPRLRVIPQHRPRSTVRWLALAASLFLMVGASYLVGLTALLRSISPVEPQAITLNVVYDGPLEVEATQLSVLEPDPKDLVQVDEVRPDWSRWPSVSPVRLIDYDQAYRPGLTSELLDSISRGLRLADDTLILRWGVIGYPHHVDDRLPELVTAPSPSPRGMEVPLAPGFDRQFLFNRNTHPVVFVPGSHASLRRVTPPLTTRVGSFDETVRQVSVGRLPDAEEIYVEDFLAAMPYGRPLPGRGRVAISRAAGPSPFGPPGTQLLQASVKVGEPRQRKSPATHLTIALDVSASMRWGHHLVNCQRAIYQLVEQMGPRDRLSLVVFNEEILHVVEAPDRENAATLLEVVRTLRSRGGTNLGGGLQRAVIHTMGTPLAHDVARRVVLVTDGREQNPPEVMAKLESLVRATSSDGLVLDLLDLSDREGDEYFLGQLALDSGGRIMPATNGEQIKWGLLESLIGDSCIVTRDTVMRITFNPEVVASYRLLGHESSQMGGFLAAGAPATLRAGEMATVLFELTLLPGESDDVATLEVDWTEPATGRKRQRRQRISRLQFAPTFHESALPLQAAAIAAETAEVLRESPFCSTRSRNLAMVLQLSEKVNPRLRARADFQRYIDVIKDIQNLPYARRNRANPSKGDGN